MQGNKYKNFIESIIYIFHYPRIARVYAADQNLRETRDVYLDYIRKNRPILARAMDLNIRDSKKNQVKILAPQIREQLLELKKYEEETEQIKQDLRDEELKKNIN